MIFTAAVPIALPAFSEDADAVGRNRLFVRGFVSERSFSAERRKIPQPYLIGLLLVLLLGVFAWPSLKLALLGANERLTSVDMRLLAVLTLAGAGCVAAAFLYGRASVLLGRAIDEDLNDLAVIVGERLVDNMHKANVQLARIAHEVVNGTDVGRVRATVAGMDEIVWIDDVGTPSFRITPKEFAAESAWRPDFIPHVTTSDRRYFKDVRARRFWFPEKGTCPENAAANGKPFTAEVVTSRTSGTVRMVIAQRAKRFPEASPKDGAVIASLEPASFSHVVVPVGFGVAIIDETGQVQLHSESSRSLTENLFDETDRSPDLMSAVRARQIRSLSADYAGRPTRLHVRPVCGTPWPVVTFASGSNENAELADTLFSWAPLFGAYIVVCIGLLLLVQIVDDGYRAAWLWPDRHGIGATTYLLVGSVLMIITVIFTEGFLNSQGWERLVIVLSVPVFSMSVTYLMLQALRDRSATGQEFSVEGGLWEVPAAVIALVSSSAFLLHARLYGLLLSLIVAVVVGGGAIFAFRRRRRAYRSLQRGERRLRAGFSWMLLGLLLTCGIAPASLLYMDAAAQASLNAARLAQLGFVNGLLDRATKLRTRFLDPKRQEEDAIRGRLAVRGNSDSDVYALDSLRRDVPRSDETLTGRLLSWGYLWNRLVPAQRSTATGAIPARPEVGDERRAGDGGWAWTRDSHCQVEQHAGAADVGHERLEIRDARLSQLVERAGSLSIDHYLEKKAHAACRDESRPWLFLVVCGLGLLLALTFLWTIVRLVFVLDADPDGEDGGGNLATGTVGCWKFTWRSADPDAGVRLDLAIPRTAEGIGECLAAHAANVPGDGAIRIVGLEALAQDAGRQRALIDAIGETIRKRPELPLTICSQFDPVQFVLTRAEQPDIEGESPTQPPKDSAKKLASTSTASERTVEEASPKEWKSLADAWIALLANFKRSTTSVSSADLVGSPAGSSGEEGLEGFYWRIWQACDWRERLVLRQLAEEGFVSHGARPTVRQLLRRRLLRRTPALSLGTPEFRRFVMRMVPKDTLKRWEASGVDTSTHQRRLIALVLAGILALLFVTQPELFTTTNAMITAIAGLLPVLIRVFGIFGEESAVRRQD